MIGLLRVIYLVARGTLKVFLQSLFAMFYISLYYLWENPKAKFGIGLRVYRGSPFGGGFWCVYAVRQRNQASKNLLSSLICLRRSGYNTVLINNGPLSDKLVDAYLPYCHTVILKPCGGRDFGGYKWGTRFLARLGENIPIDQVIYCNDSIFIRPSTFEQLLNRIKQLNHDYIGITETFEIHHHVQSWFFVISARIYHSSFFTNFWHRYKSYSHRQHCINKGEVKISKLLLGAGVLPHVLYTQNDILDLIFAGTLDGALSKVMLFFRPHEYAKLMDTIRDIAFAGASDTQLVVTFLRRELLEKLAMANTMHHVNLVLLRFTAFPFLKKDLVHRAQYFVTQVDNSIADWSGVDAEELPEILAYYRYRDSLRWQHSLSAMLARLGVI
jgi:Rhamnan synthesis protein F